VLSVETGSGSDGIMVRRPWGLRGLAPASAGVRTVGGPGVVRPVSRRDTGRSEAATGPRAPSGHSNSYHYGGICDVSRNRTARIGRQRCLANAGGTAIPLSIVRREKQY